MKRFLLFCAAICAFYFCISSCTKTNNVTTTVRDTTVLIHKDTVINKDTIVVHDTTYQTTPKNPITGLWVGSYFLSTDAVDSFQYQFSILPNGTVYTIGSGLNGSAGYATGPWTLTGTTFSATLTSQNGVNPENIQVVTATYDSVGGRLYNGTWVDTRGNGGQTGTFSLRRVN